MHVKALDQEFVSIIYENLQDKERHTSDTDIQLDKQVIRPVITSEEEKQVVYLPTTNSEQDSETLSKPKMVQSVSLLVDTPNPLQIIAQPKVVPQISLIDKSGTQGKLITMTHAIFGEILKLKSMKRVGIQKIIKEIPPYTDPLCIPPPRPPEIPLLRFQRKLLNLNMEINMDNFNVRD